MALIKEIINPDNGAIASYHRIVRLDRNNDSVFDVTLKDYADASYREAEKEKEEKDAYWTAKIPEVQEYMNIPEDQRTEEQQKLIDDALAYLEESGKRTAPFYIFETNVTIDVELMEEDFSYSKAYEVLKTIEPFDGAIDG